MSFLVVGSVVVDVNRENASQPESDVVGATVRAFAGNLRSTRRVAKRKWSFTTRPMTWTEETTLLTTIGTPDGGAFVACSGNFINGGSPVTCQVLVTNREFVKETNTVVRRRLTLALAEV